jgi:hypothetical protein
VSDFRVVDLWADGKRLTCHDNAAFTPTLVHHMRSAAERVRRREVPPCPFPWRPSRSGIFVARVSPDEFVTTVDEAVHFLAGPAR